MHDYSDVNAVFPLAVYTITDVDTGAETFTVAGDVTDRFLDEDPFSVVDSTGNDDVWTVASSAYSSGPDTTAITVNEDITDATVDGIILHDEISDFLNASTTYTDTTDRDLASPLEFAGEHEQRMSNEIRALGRTVGVALGAEIIDASGLFYYNSGGSLIFGSGAPVDIYPGKGTLADDDDSYVEVDSAGAVTDNTTSFTAGKYPLAIVTTVSGAVTRIQDKRGVLYLQSTADNVVGPGSATDNALVVFDTASGKLVKNSVIIYNAGALSGLTTLTASGDYDGVNHEASGHIEGTVGNGFLELRGDSGASNDVKIYDTGIVDLEGQSSARAYRAAAQSIPDAAVTIIAFDTENWDEQGEFNSTSTTGTADATEASKLHDADGGFDASMVGASVYNTTDNTYTTVSGFVDSGELDLTDDIMVNGEGYEIYFARFTATKAGKYVIAGGLGITSAIADRFFVTYVYVNGVDNTSVRLHSSSVFDIAATLPAIVDLAANDYVDLRVFTWFGTTEPLDVGSSKCFLAISKIS